MPQGVLNFSVASTDESLTSNAGTILFGEYLKAIGVDKLCNTHLPLPRSNRGYLPFEHIQPLVLMLHSGGRVLEDVRMIQNDTALQTVLKIPRIPLAESIGKWMSRHGLLGVYGMEAIHRRLLKRYVKRITEPLVLDIDASIVFSDKSTAEMTYKLQKGFAPMMGHINGGFVLHSEFRSGNIAPADHNLTFLKRCQDQLPKGVRLAFLRADSASYQAKVFNHADREGITYVIGAPLDSAIYTNIEQITQEQWQPLQTKEGKAHYVTEEVAEFLHTMQQTDHAFRLIVTRKKIAPLLPHIWDTLTLEEKMELTRERYHVIATNADESMSAQEVVRFYRKRGDQSENRIKELKGGFNLSYLPSSDFMANAFYFQIGILAYNLFILFKQTLQQNWHKHTVSTIRYKLYHIAGKVITHSRQIILKIPGTFVETFHAIRKRIYQASLE